MDTMGKKEREQKKKKKAQEKAERKSERESNKGKSLEDMMVYLDENGNFTNTPPDPTKKKQEVDLDNIQLGAAKREPENPADRIKNGVVSFFNDAKGYGFITDTATRQNIFVHANELSEPIKDRDKVTFEIGHGPKGPVALKVKKVK